MFQLSCLPGLLPQTAGPRSKEALKVVSVASLLLVALTCLHAGPAQAGPLKDALERRAAERQAAAQGTDEMAGEASERTGFQRGLPAGVTRLSNLAWGDGPYRKLDVYRPASFPAGTPAAGAPLLFMVHGGGWKHGDKAAGSVVDNKVAHWVTQGVVLVSVNYPMLPGTDPVRQATEVAKALAWTQRQAASWGADPARVVLMGHSAGAHLVALNSADPAVAKAEGARPWLGTVVLDTATHDVVETMSASHARLYDEAFGTDHAYWRQASPAHRLTGVPAPMLLVCSSRRSSSCPQAQSFDGRLKAVGARSTVLPQNLSHRSINADLGEAGAYTAAVDAFLRSVGWP